MATYEQFQEKRSAQPKESEIDSQSQIGPTDENGQNPLRMGHTKPAYFLSPPLEFNMETTFPVSFRDSELETRCGNALALAAAETEWEPCWDTDG